MNKITILGTGHATVTRCYNTCFVLHTDTTQLLVDAGGGNGILTQLRRAGIAIDSLHHLYVTHAHTDHILGTIWIISMVLSDHHYEGQLHIYRHDKGLLVMRTLCQLTLSAKQQARMDSRVVFHRLTDGQEFGVGDIAMQCFDIHSSKELQYGFRATLPDGTVLVCLGDEPYNPLCQCYVGQPDWLISEAFCLYADRDHYHPYEMCHSTALDAGRVAQQLQARHLILYHTEDDHLDTRRQRYAAEAAQAYHGPVYVPDDLDVIER